MSKLIRLVSLELLNFAGLKSLLLTYGLLTALSGRNGEGKTTIGTAPVWVLWGKDLLGSDYMKPANSPRPSNYEYDRVYAAVVLSIDGTEYKFAREIKGKSNNFYINDVPKTATEYADAVAALLNQEEFIAQYFPAYFFSLRPTEQRELLMRGVTPPANKIVFAEMSRTSPEQKVKDIVLNPQATKLAELVKKHSLDDLQAKHKKAKTDLDKEHSEAVGATKKVKEMLERLPVVTGSLEELEEKVKIAREAFEKEDDVVAEAASVNSHYTALKARYVSLEHQVKESFNAFPALRDEPIKDTCRTCQQPLKPEDVEKVQADKDQRVAAYKAKHKDLQAKRDEAKAALEAARWIDVEEQKEKACKLQWDWEVLANQLRDAKEHKRLKTEVEAAAAAEAATLSSLRESTFILDAIKAYRAKEAELQAAEIQAKFTTLSIRLFKWVASRGEWEPDFSVQRDGKDYKSLSTGEKIGAGLELVEVLHNQSGLVTPIFIDGIGEYTDPVKAFDQVITGRTIREQELKIQIDN